MGRRKLDKATRRGDWLAVRLTAAERAELDALVGDGRGRLSRWARAVVMREARRHVRESRERS